ncbi:MAG: P1 family peptidase [Candidatus Aminicenantes bacterium]
MAKSKKDHSGPGGRPSGQNFPASRKRLRDLGIRIGRYPAGRYNAITDVPNVCVGHSTIISGSGKLKAGRGPVRTGVTAILPNRGNIFMDRVVGSGFILNGAGEVSGLTQVMEWGIIETPILLTNTLSVGTCSEATVKFMIEKYPGIGVKEDVIIPVVGECDDSWLNDVAGGHVKHSHVYEAMENASSGRVAEGSVGGGTGMITCDFKSGMGTSSRKLPEEKGGYTVGVMVMSNFGRMRDLRINGLPIGELLHNDYKNFEFREDSYGSIIVVVGTNVPLSTHQITRLCKRSALGIGRVGSYASHGSGEIIVGFSTANTVPRQAQKMIYKIKILLDEAIDPLYEAVVEATEEAILNSLCMAQTMEGHSGHVSPELPLEKVKNIFEAIQRNW